MQLLKHCHNPKVLVGVFLIGLGIYLFVSQLLTAIAPLLILAICPLSMLLMMSAMGKEKDTPQASAGTTDRRAE